MPAQLGLLAAGGALSVSAGNDQTTEAITDLTLGQGVAQLPQALKDDLASLSQACTAVEPHQVRDGENFTVEGMRIEVGGEVVAVLASATCGGPIAHPVVEEEQEAPEKRKSPPVPEPVQTSAPVTG